MARPPTMYRPGRVGAAANETRRRKTEGQPWQTWRGARTRSEPARVSDPRGPAPLRPPCYHPWPGRSRWGSMAPCPRMQRAAPRHNEERAARWRVRGCGACRTPSPLAGNRRARPPDRVGRNRRAGQLGRGPANRVGLPGVPGRHPRGGLPDFHQQLRIVAECGVLSPGGTPPRGGESGHRGRAAPGLRNPWEA